MANLEDVFHRTLNHLKENLEDKSNYLNEVSDEFLHSKNLSLMDSGLKLLVAKKIGLLRKTLNENLDFVNAHHQVSPLLLQTIGEKLSNGCEITKEISVIRQIVQSLNEGDVKGRDNFAVQKKGAETSELVQTTVGVLQNNLLEKSAFFNVQQGEFARGKLEGTHDPEMESPILQRLDTIFAVIDDARTFVNASKDPSPQTIAILEQKYTKIYQLTGSLFEVRDMILAYLQSTRSYDPNEYTNLTDKLGEHELRMVKEVQKFESLKGACHNSEIKSSIANCFMQTQSFLNPARSILESRGNPRDARRLITEADSKLVEVQNLLYRMQSSIPVARPEVVAVQVGPEVSEPLQVEIMERNAPEWGSALLEHEKLEIEIKPPVDIVNKFENKATKRKSKQKRKDKAAVSREEATILDVQEVAELSSESRCCFCCRRR